MPQTTVRLFREAKPSGKCHVLKWLTELKKTDKAGYAKCSYLIFQLESLGSELEFPESKPLGNGLFELRARKGKVRYRIIYFFNGKEAVCSNAFIKKTRETPQAEIVTAHKRKALVVSDVTKYTVNFQEKT